MFLSQGLRGAANLKANAITALLGGTTVQPDALATLSGVINRSQMGVVINALSQKQSSDILSAPKVTTISGAQAQIRVVQEFIYPTEYSIPQPGGSGGGGTSGGNAGMGTPSIPSGWKTREVGVILNVTPTVNADGYTINLTLVPEVAAFLGMLDYSPPPQIDAFGNAAVSYNIVQPLFETRNLTTSVVIWDGQTVVLGGLMRDEVTKMDDKIPFFGDIPFVGRLFRSKVNSRSKRNLLIFVTARLVDPAGNPIHKQEAAPVIPVRK
jgi:general secretion pathway protein D